MKASTAVRVMALFDLAVTAPLAVPALDVVWLNLLLTGGGWWTLPPAWSLSPAALMLAQLAGVLGICWNGARACWPGDRRLVAIDGVARIAVATLLLRLTWQGGPPSLIAFVGTELCGAVVAALMLWPPSGRRTRN